MPRGSLVLRVSYAIWGLDKIEERSRCVTLRTEECDVLESSALFQFRNTSHFPRNVICGSSKVLIRPNRD